MDISMDFLKLDVNDIIGYIMLGVIYLFHFLNSKQTRTSSLLFKRDMTSKVDKTYKDVQDIMGNTVASVQGGIEKAKTDVDALTQKMTSLDTEMNSMVARATAELRADFEKEIKALKTENKKLKTEFLKSVKHNNELCRRGVTKQITDNLEDKDE